MITEAQLASLILEWWNMGESYLCAHKIIRDWCEEQGREITDFSYLIGYGPAGGTVATRWRNRVTKKQALEAARAILKG